MRRSSTPSPVPDAGLFQGLYFGLGYGVGALAGGAAAARYGYPVLFAGAAACVLMGWLVGCAARYFVQRHEARYPSVHADVRSGSEGGHCDRLHQGLSEGLHCHGHSRLGRVGAEGVESKEPFLAARLLQEERPRKGHYVQLEMTEPQ